MTMCSGEELKTHGKKRYKAGIKKVVEWVEENGLYWKSTSTTKHDYYIPLCLADTWQAQKKDWGVDAKL